ncbi:alpha-amylase family glycosyl hydrolase [Arsenicibacter rosenii]|uniref:Alpha-amylase n=1 Tax=Arsenicibacter rosenii TaxID=1750698 RepID=A0A1S2VMC9_9BACT|nr:alpha-amylase family glycosyl hydrolase [Arsenicibacter rosenii]OIN59375.1 alpha-amylase [Arsenicibacter rosenii]
MTTSNVSVTAARMGHTGVHYEIFVRAFADSNGDSIGDLNGVTANLDYLKDLGVAAIWLMPVNPSPSYHKYDVVDYYGIDPEYGTLEDFKRLVQEAHRRGIKVIMDFVINHTSRQHPWFLEACKGPDNPYWDWYVWMTPKQIKDLNIATREITADSQEKNPWHKVPKSAYDERYYALFWSGMPDLNYDNPNVRREIYKAGKYWLGEIGVDGFRLDAARHIYPDWEEPKNHAFWEEFRQEMESVKPDVYLIGEVWTRPERIAPYFRGLHANFNFDLQLALVEIIRNEADTESIIPYLNDVHAAFSNVNPQFIDALILSNHDQERIGSSLNGNIDHLKVGANLLMTLPGNPYMYYGEEIGMLGPKPDEYIREPFIWDIGKNDRQRARWRKARYSTSRTVRPLTRQKKDPNSLYHHYRRFIHFRNQHPVLNDNLSRLEHAGIRQDGIVSFIRCSNGQRLLVVQNLTGKAIDVVFSPTEAELNTIIFQTIEGTSLADGILRLPAYGCALLEA